MANGAFKFKDNSGNVVSFISGSGSDILISGGTLNLSGMTGLTLGNLTMSGTTQNAVSTSHAASYLLTSSFNSYTGTTNTIIGSLQTSTGSLNTFTSSTDGRLNSIEGKTGSYATTGSNTFNGNLTVTGYIDTQELRTTYISSSILYRSGSTKFGDELTDTHAFTGSVLISGSLSVPSSNLVSGSSQIDVLSTTNAARIATTGSNTFTSNQIVSGSITSTSTITGTNFVTNGSTLYGVTLKGRSADNYGAIGFYSSDGATRYGYVQSHSTNGGQLNITADGGGQIIMDSRGVVVTSTLSGGSATFSGNLSVTGTTNEQLILDFTAAGGSYTYQSFRLNGTNKYRIIGDTTGNLIIRNDIASTNNLTLSSSGAATFSASVGTTALNMNNMASLGSIAGGSIYLPHTAVIMFRTTDGATARGKITADNSNNLLLNSDNGGYVGIGNSAPSFPLEVTTNTATTVSIATFHNLDYTVGTKSFIRVRAQTSAGSSYSSYFGTGQDGTLHITANNFARGGDIKIDPLTGNITTSGTINGLLIPNDLFAQQFLLMGA